MYLFYKIDGSSHWSGISWETKICRWLNKKYSKKEDCLELGIFQKIKFLEKGGTKNKADIICLINDKDMYSISVKSNKDNGTVDLINTTKLNLIFNDVDILWCKDELKKIRNKYIKKENVDIEKVKLEWKSISAKLFSKIDKKRINTVFEKINNELCDYYIFYNKFKNSASILRKKNIYFKKYIGGSDFSFKQTTNAIESAKIFYENIDLHLRIRLTLNNGTNALIGKSKSNKNSSFSIKIQIDSPSHFIKKSKPGVFNL